jgi:uncharacterized protein YcgL (UPF0745 family)
MFPCSTSIDNLPKSIRHEIDTGNPWPQLDLQAGKQLGSMDESMALKDISCDGFHMQHLSPGDAELFSHAA